MTKKQILEQQRSRKEGNVFTEMQTNNTKLWKSQADQTATNVTVHIRTECAAQIYNVIRDTLLIKQSECQSGSSTTSQRCIQQFIRYMQMSVQSSMKRILNVVKDILCDAKSIYAFGYVCLLFFMFVLIFFVMLKFTSLLIYSLRLLVRSHYYTNTFLFHSGLNISSSIFVLQTFSDKYVND